jgi:hypothetical protein
MKKCCVIKLKSVIALLKIREDMWKRRSDDYLGNIKFKQGAMETMAEHLATINYRTESKHIREMVEILLEKGR